jgi:hypothetical protein
LRRLQQSAFEHQFPNAPAGGDRGLRDVRCLSVPDVRAQGGSDGGTPIEQLAAAGFVGANAGDAALVEDPHGVAEDPRRVQCVPGNDRHHYVQF